MGEAIPLSEVPSPWDEEAAIDGHAIRCPAGPELVADRARAAARSSSSSPRTRRSSPTSASGWPSGRRSGSGGWAAIASHGSGDLFIAFATGNRGLSRTAGERDPRQVVETRMVVDRAISPLFQAAVEATEAAVVNALLSAETLTGRDGITARALDHERLLDVMARYGRGPRARAS